MRRAYLSLLILLGVAIGAASTYCLTTFFATPYAGTTVTMIVTSASKSTNSTIAAGNVPVQSGVLSFVGQQAIAHAAAIFATLTATFTFATGFKNELNYTRRRGYVAVLTGLFASAAYACLRMILYAQVSTAVLNDNSTNSTAYTLTTYWAHVYKLAGNGSWYTATVQSVTLSLWIGCLLSIAVGSYLPDPSRGFIDMYEMMPDWFKLTFFWWAPFGFFLDAIILPWLFGYTTSWPPQNWFVRLSHHVVLIAVISSFMLAVVSLRLTHGNLRLLRPLLATFRRWWSKLMWFSLIL